MKRQLIINPCMCGDDRAFAKINYENGRLSISGVIGPTKYGNARGSCGQCVDEIRDGRPTEGWTEEMLKAFCDIWDTWHLNDMRPYCEHQEKLGWRDIAKKEVTLYHYELKYKILKEQYKIEQMIINMAKKEGEKIQLDALQRMILNLPYSKTTYDKLKDEELEYYLPRDNGATEVRRLGWVRSEEHPEGLLGKACPICGYKYGSKWLTEKVPKYIIDYLFNLPESKVQPAWI